LIKSLFVELLGGATFEGDFAMQRAIWLN